RGRGCQNATVVSGVAARRRKREIREESERQKLEQGIVPATRQAFGAVSTSSPNERRASHAPKNSVGRVKAREAVSGGSRGPPACVPEGACSGQPHGQARGDRHESGAPAPRRGRTGPHLRLQTQRGGRGRPPAVLDCPGAF